MKKTEADLTELFKFVSPLGYGGGKITHISIHYADNSKVDLDGKKFSSFLKEVRKIHGMRS